MCFFKSSCLQMLCLLWGCGWWHSQGWGAGLSLCPPCPALSHA